MRDWLAERWRKMGRALDREHERYYIENCNCLVRQGTAGVQVPAIKLGKGNFTDPCGRPIANPTSVEMMDGREIYRRMKADNEVFIGHLFEPGGGCQYKRRWQRR